MREPVFCPDCGDINAFTAADRKKKELLEKEKQLLKGQHND